MKSYKELDEYSKDFIVKDIEKSELTYKEVCDKHSIGYYVYRRIMEEYNMPRKISKRKSSNIIDHSFFKVIDSEEKAYWLGFLYADGCIFRQGEYYTVILDLSYIDESHLYKFKKSISTSYGPKNYINKSNVSHCRMECCSKQMFYDLIDLGCVEKKTLVLDFPTNKQVPDYLIHHFMRGYFDGDGTINSHKEVGNKKDQVRFQILGTEKFIKGYLKVLSNIEVGKNTTLQDTKNIKTIQIGGNVQSKKLFDFLYKDATMYLDRKYEKYIQYFYK